MKLPGAIQRLRSWVTSSLQRKFILLFASILAITSIAFLLTVVSQYKQQLVNEHARASLQVNLLLQASLENAMLKRDIPGLRGIVKKLGEQKGIAGVMIVNPQFEVRFSSYASKLNQVLKSEQVTGALAQRKPHTHFVEGEGGAEILRSVNPVPNQAICKECHGPATKNPINGLLVVDYDATSIKQAALKSAMMLGGIGAFVTLATVVVIWVGLHVFVLSRVDTLRFASRRLAEGELDTRAAIAGNDEVTELGASFDTMAERLGKTLKDLDAAGQFLQGVIDAIPDGVRVIDEDFNIIKANDAYCRQVGKPREEVVGDKCYRSSHGREEPCPYTLIDCPVHDLRSSREIPRKVNHKHIDGRGEDFFVEVSMAPVQLVIDGKEQTCVIESIRNLAEQARISHEQRLSEIGQLATGVAHEIHNPLSSIQLALKSIQLDLEREGHGAGTQEYFELAEAEIAKCLKVTDGLMLLSQPSGDSSELIDIDKIIREVISLLSYQADKAGVKVELDLQDGLRLIASDSDLRMLTVNLAQNAFHAMPDGGTLVISSKVVDDAIELSFTDSGVGIPHENLDKIFLPFWTKRVQSKEGRGLGLSICKAIVERLGGTITIESEVGVGSTFKLSLPNADSQDANS